MTCSSFSESRAWFPCLPSPRYSTSHLRFMRWLFFGCLTSWLATIGPISHGQDVPSDLEDLDSHLAILNALENATVAAIEKAEKSVVAIGRVRRDRNPGNRALESLKFEQPFPFQDPTQDPDFVPSFFGSGVIISNDGFIVTCAHVLDDPRRNDYYVWLDKRSYPARVVGKPAKVYAADPFSDLAVLQIDAQGLSPIRFGDTSQLKKGRFVIALGNPDAIARDGQASASWGIISNLGRISPEETPPNQAPHKETVHQYGTLIQTDAKLNLGTSGGALINLRGEMIGLTTALAAQSGYEHSAGFAIAADELFLRVVQALKRGKLPEYGFLGIQPEELSFADRRRGLHGARVSVVLPGLPGDKAGLRPDDVIVQVGGTPIQNQNDLFRELSFIAAGADVDLLVHRPRTGFRVPSVLRLSTQLSKKYVATTRPSFAINAPATWRGLTVEYATAVPSEQTRAGRLGSRHNSPKIAVLSVEPGTPAWQAGLRPGDGIQSVNGISVESPEAFWEVVRNLSGEVTLTTFQTAGRPQERTIPETKDES